MNFILVLLRRLDPVSIFLIGVVVVMGYVTIESKFEKAELARQARVIQESDKEKSEKLNEARNDQSKAVEAINNGNFDNEYLKRLQLDD